MTIRSNSRASLRMSRLRCSPIVAPVSGNTNRPEIAAERWIGQHATSAELQSIHNVAWSSSNDAAQLQQQHRQQTGNRYSRSPEGLEPVGIT